MEVLHIAGDIAQILIDVLVVIYILRKWKKEDI